MTNHSVTSSGTRVFRGASLPEVIAAIKAELGPDAVITRQRTGLTGGFGGFFQKEFVEVEATTDPVPGHNTTDFVVDDEPIRPDFGPPVATAAPASNGVADAARAIAAAKALAAKARPATGELAPSTPASAISHAEAEVDAGEDDTFILPEPAVILTDTDTAIAGPSPAFAAMLEAEGLLPREEPTAAPVVETPAQIRTHERALVKHGLDPDLAREIGEEAAIHDLAFAGRAAKRSVRRALARRIPVARALEPNARVAIIGAPGSGRTTIVHELAAAYAKVRPVTLVCLDSDGGDARTALAGTGVDVLAGEPDTVARALAGRAGVVLVDTPAVAGLNMAAAATLATNLERLAVTEVHAVLPATLAPGAAHELLDTLAPLRPVAAIIGHANSTRQLGGPIGVAITSGVPISFVAGEQVLPADAVGLAEVALP